MPSPLPAKIQALADTPQLHAFCGALERYLLTGEGETELTPLAAALADEARTLELPPEHILHAMRVARCRGSHGKTDDATERLEARRYAWAVGLLLRTYFGIEEENVDAVGDVSRATSVSEREFRAEVAVRTVADPQSGAIWRVHQVREGYTWDPEIEMRRRDWLSCRTGTERRFITPAPADWLTWSEAELLAAIHAAPIDKRREPPTP